MSATGEAVVAWSFQPEAGGPRELWAAIAPPGAPFGAPVRIGAPRAGVAVRPRGRRRRARAARVRDRRRPARRRARARRATSAPRPGSGDAKDLFAVFPAAAVRADGGAVVAWQTRSRGDVQAVTARKARAVRRAGDARRQAAALAVDRRSSLRLFTARCSAPGRRRRVRRPAARRPDERRRQPARDDPARRPRAGHLGRARRRATASGGARRARRRCRSPAAPPSCASSAPSCATPGSLTPLLLADGTAGVAWTDNGDSERDGRLHLARRGRGRRAPTRPRRASACSPPTRRVLRRRDPLGSGALLGGVRRPRRRSRATRARARTVSLRRAGDAPADDRSRLGRPIATLRGGPVRVLRALRRARRAPRRGHDADDPSSAAARARRTRGCSARWPAATATTSSCRGAPTATRRPRTSWSTRRDPRSRRGGAPGRRADRQEATVPDPAAQRRDGALRHRPVVPRGHLGPRRDDRCGSRDEARAARRGARARAARHRVRGAVRRAAVPDRDRPGELSAGHGRSRRTGPRPQPPEHHDAGAQILSAGPAGLTRSPTLRVEGSTGCPQAAARANGAGIVAVHAFRSLRPRTIHAALREPGGRWGALAEVTGAADLAERRPARGGRLRSRGRRRRDRDAARARRGSRSRRSGARPGACSAPVRRCSRRAARRAR